MRLKTGNMRLPPPKIRPPLGEWTTDIDNARKRGMRYRSWSEIAPFWFGNAGITRPYAEFFAPAARAYHRMLGFYRKGDVPSLMEMQEREIGRTRKSIKGIFGSGASVLLDSNGSCIISTISKGVKARIGDFESLTYSNQGRLVYSALGFESRSVTDFAMNFDQQLALFDHPLPKSKIPVPPRLPSTVHVIDVFDAKLNYKSDDEIISETLSRLGNPRLKLLLLLHVSRSGRVLPAAEMAKAARRMRHDVLVLVDGCQAIGRVSADEMRNAYRHSDGYILVGHKALGSMITGAAALKPGVEMMLGGAIEKGPLVYPKLFQFESEELNERVLSHMNREGMPHFMVSLPEMVSLGLALDSSAKNFGRYAEKAMSKSRELSRFLSHVPEIRLLRNGGRTVPDIVSFFTRPIESVYRLKEYLQESAPHITIAPITQSGAARIAIDPKLPSLSDAVDAIKKKIGNFFSR